MWQKAFWESFLRESEMKGISSYANDKVKTSNIRINAVLLQMHDW